MNYILEAITEYPEAFNFQLRKNASKDEHLQILFSAKPLGTSIQQNSMTITKLYFGWTVLVKLGLRSIAMPMGAQLLENYNWTSHYIYASDICNQLMKHYYMYGNGNEAVKYEHMQNLFRDTYVLESKMETLYLSLIYKSEIGLDIDKVLIINSLKEMKLKLKYDSCKYHFYYFQTQCIINEGAEYEKWCLVGLKYFKNLYFKHEIYTNIFIKNLFTYYLSIDEYNKVKNEIPNYINETIEGSKSWFRLKYIYITALLNTFNYQESKKEIEYCKNLKDFNKLSLAHIEEWEYLNSIIKNKKN